MVPPIEFTEFIWIIIVITIRQIKDHWRGRFYLTNWVTTSKAEPFNNLGGGGGRGERERENRTLWRLKSNIRLVIHLRFDEGNHSDIFHLVAHADNYHSTGNRFQISGGAPPWIGFPRPKQLQWLAHSASNECSWIWIRQMYYLKRII